MNTYWELVSLQFVNLSCNMTLHEQVKLLCGVSLRERTLFNTLDSPITQHQTLVKLMLSICDVTFIELQSSRKYQHITDTGFFRCDPGMCDP